jgi:hypothetical protein
MSDFIDELIELKKRVKALEQIAKGHTESKTFLVSNPDGITVGLYVPPAFVAVNPHDNLLERKFIVGMRGHIRVGTVQLDWAVNGTPLGSHEITDNPLHDPIDLDLDSVVEVFHGDMITIAVSSATSEPPMDLAAVFFLDTRVY